MADNTNQQMFDLWKKHLDEGTQAWARLMTETSASPPPDAGAFWRPIIDQGFQMWARVFAQTPLTPDVMTQWKQLMDQAIEAWSRALGQVMGTDAFAQVLGRTLDQFLVSPMAMVPGTFMPMLIPDDKTRADVVGYLSTLKPE